MDILQAIILGLVQGLTEFIPVSSSAHLVLVPRILGWQEQSVAFDLVLHGATLLALIIYFRKRLLGILFNLFSSSQEEKKSARKLLLLMIIASIPAAIATFLIEDLVDSVLKDSAVIVVTLILVGVALIFSDRIFKNNQVTIERLSLKSAVFIGLFQSLALIRGVSRSGITIIGGGVNGLTREAAAEFAFLIGIPIIAGGFAFQLLDSLKHPAPEPLTALIAGFIAATLSGLFAINFLINYLKTKGLAVFGVYRIILALIFLLIMIF